MSAPTALMMPPFTDTLGRLIIIPAYLNPATTAGGPTLPVSVSTPPTFIVNGSGNITPTLVTIDAELRAIVYQMSVALLSTDVLTMAAPQGWAVTAGSGDLGGTSAGGTASGPLTVTNNVGRTVETQYDTTSRAMKMGVNSAGSNSLAQPRVNWASRLFQAGWTGTVLTFDAATKLPATIGGGGVSCYLFATAGNGIDSSGYPMQEGRWRLSYGDASPGVDATHHKLNVELIGNTGWTEHIISAGTWDGSQWHDIVKEYTWVYPGDGSTSYIRLDLYSTAAGGVVTFPDKGNGQVELCVTSPGAADPDIPNPVSYDPLGVDSRYLEVHQTLRPRAIRWMNSNSAADVGGDTMPAYVADLDLRQVNDSLWSLQTPFPSTVVNIIKVEPVTSWDAIIPYLAGTNAMTTANFADFSSNVLMFCTTDVDHGLYSNSQLIVFLTTAAPNPVIDTGLTLDANIVTTSGTTTITISDTTGLSGTFLQIDSEQVGVLSVLSSTSLSVSRGIHGTTGATHTSGVTVYPGVSVDSGGHFAWVTGNRTFVISRSVPASTPNTTIVGEVDFTPPDCPTFDFTAPANSGSNPYEMQARLTNDVAAANAMETILWTNVPLLASDAVITEIVQNRIAPYIGSFVTLVVELSNELWNFQFHQTSAAYTLYRTAPNPETGGVGFPDQRSFIVSRQNHVNQLAKAAFTAAGLDPARVYNFQPGRAQNNFVQAETTASIVYAQAHGIPIDYMSMGGYAGITPEVWTLFWSWMPVADGGSASWSRAYARRMMMSYLRAWFWFSPFMGVAMTGAAQAMAWYNAGKSVAGNGVGSATANTGRGKLCGYEVATEIDAATIGDFLKPIAMEHDLIQDGIPQYAGDTGWLATETAYIAAMQGAPEMYGALMPPASFPGVTSPPMAFACYFASVNIASGVPTLGEALYDLYDFLGQRHGPGVSNTMGWHPTTPTFQTWQNESVRAQALIDWNGSDDSSGGLAVTAAGDTLVGAADTDHASAGGLAVTTSNDTLAAAAANASNVNATLAKTTAGDTLVGAGDNSATGTVIAKVPAGRLKFWKRSSLGDDSELVTVQGTTGKVQGVPLVKSDWGDRGYIGTILVPSNAQLSDGLTFRFYLTDDGKQAVDLGKKIYIGLTLKRLPADSTIDITVGAADEVTVQVTLSTTSGGMAISTLPVALADLPAGIDVSDLILCQIRRIGFDRVHDTCQGRALLLGVDVENS